MLQFFITVPVALGTPPPNGAGFSLHAVGLAFSTALVGGALGALFVIMIEQAISGMLSKRNVPAFAQIEYRLLPAMIGPLLVTAALFWIGEPSSRTRGVAMSLTARRYHGRESDLSSSCTYNWHGCLCLGGSDGIDVCDSLSVS